MVRKLEATFRAAGRYGLARVRCSAALRNGVTSYPGHLEAAVTAHRKLGKRLTALTRRYIVGDWRVHDTQAAPWNGAPW